MRWVKLAIACLFAVLIFSGILNPILSHISDKNWLTHYVTETGLQGHISVLLAALVFVSIGGPRQVTAFMFGYLYGPYFGILVTLIVCVIAAAINYMVARMVLAKTLSHYFPYRMQKFSAFVSRATFMKVLMIRLLPVGSNLVTNLLSGSVGVPLSAFLVASFIGYFPQTLIFALIGFGINGANHGAIYLSVGLSIVSFILTGLIYRDHLKQKMSALNMESKA